jgi:hypothetical protein
MTASTLYQLGLSVNISDQNEWIPLHNACVVSRQVKCINLLGEINLIWFRQTEVIGEWLDEFGENR